MLRSCPHLHAALLRFLNALLVEVGGLHFRVIDTRVGVLHFLRRFTELGERLAEILLVARRLDLQAAFRPRLAGDELVTIDALPTRKATAVADHLAVIEA